MTVYFAHSASRDAVKIGFTTISLRTRLSYLRHRFGVPDLTLYGFVDGGRTIENFIHKKLAHLSLGQEWFRMSPDVTYFIVDEGWRDEADKLPVGVNLEVPGDLRERIERQAKIDLRSYKAEILILLNEALATRDRKK